VSTDKIVERDTNLADDASNAESKEGDSQLHKYSGSKRWLAFAWLICTWIPLQAQTPASNGTNAEELRKGGAESGGQPDQRAHPGELEFQHRPVQPDTERFEYSARNSGKYGKELNVIVRWITPVIFQPDPATAEAGYYGLGDMNPSFFFSPKHSKIIWGVGPTFIIADSNKFSQPRLWKMERGSDSSCSGAAG
jgi:hypothetical protein